MVKYNFFELKQGKDLPIDVNKIAELVASKMRNPEELKKVLDNARASKIFGKVIHYDVVNIRGNDITIDVLTFKFRYGIVQEFTIKKLLDSQNIEERNVINDNVSFKKLGKGEICQKNK